MNKERKKQLKKENTQKEFIEIEGRKLDTACEVFFKDLGINDESELEEILKKLDKALK